MQKRTKQELFYIDLVKHIVRFEEERERNAGWKLYLLI